MENAKKFFEEIIKTEEAKQLITACEAPETPEDAIRTYAKIAKELGVELSEDEITAYFDNKLDNCAASKEIDDDELEQFTGGLRLPCFNSFVNRENCWWNDGCDLYMNQYATYSCSWSTKSPGSPFSVGDNRRRAPSNNNPAKIVRL